MHPVLFVLLGFILLVVFSGGYMFYVACRRGPQRNWLDKAVTDKTPYGQFHEAIIASDNWLKQHEVQDVYIKNRTGLRLHGLWIPAANPKGTILLVHGYRSTYLLDFALVLDVYHRLGFHMMIPEQRAHGESEGKYITFGVKESEDMLDWLYYHNETFGKLPVIFHGMSMGASTVLYLTGENLPDNVRGTVADCGFTSPKEILKQVYKSMIHLPAGPTIWAAELFARVFAGFSLTQKDTRLTLRKSRVPVLMIHGLADDFVPCSMTKEGYDACTGEKQLLLVANAGHGISFLSDPVGYASAVFYFLKRHIEKFEF